MGTLPDGYDRYGIEPNGEAAVIAKKRGVSIIGCEAMDELNGYEGFFGSIILADVAEHLADPAAVFRHLAKYLAPGGVLLVLTGNADYWLAKWSLPFYWYMSFPIHLVYLSDTHFDWIARHHEWQIVERLHFSHQDHGRWKCFRDWERAVRILLWQRALKGNWAGVILKKTFLFRGIAAMSSPPLLFSLRDHVGIVFQIPVCPDGDQGL